MIKYPSIEQLRSVVREVKSRHDFQGKDENGDAIYQHTSPYPTLEFQGTVKVHGTNASVIRTVDGEKIYQSRNRVLSLEKDNAQFMISMMNKDLDSLFNLFPPDLEVILYGEWCGDNIQKGVAITGLPKMFIIFGVRVDGEWVEIPTNLKNTKQNIYNIMQFPTYNISIDFENPELIQNKLIEETLAVEEECPVGKFFGVSGVGEGIVYTCLEDRSIRFKSKGEKHSVSKVKTLNSVNVESVKEVMVFVDNVVTEARMNQSVDYLKEMGLEVSPKSTGDFLRWVVNDILKEETDTIVENQLDMKKVKSSVASKARLWFLNQV